MKLRKEVKRVMVVLSGVLLLVTVIVLDHNYTEKNIERCIHNGVDSRICEELRK